MSLFDQFRNPAPPPAPFPVLAPAPANPPTSSARFAVTGKYAAMWAELDPDDLRTLIQAREVKRRLEADGFVCSAIHGNTRRIGTDAAFIPDEKLIADGFPLDWPALYVIFDPSGDCHAVDQLEKWLNSGLWNWGMRWCLQRVW